MVSINCAIRLLPMSQNSLEIYSSVRSIFVNEEYNIKVDDLLKNILVSISNATFSGYKYSYFYDNRESQFAFENQKVISIADINAYLNKRKVGYSIFNTTFYWLALKELNDMQYSFMQCAYEFANPLLYSILNDTSLGFFFTDNFLFNKCKQVKINKPGENVYESYYLDAKQSKILSEAFELFFRKKLNAGDKEELDVLYILKMAKYPFGDGLIIQRSL